MVFITSVNLLVCIKKLKRKMKFFQERRRKKQDLNLFRLATIPKKRAMEDYAPLSAGSEAHWEVNTFFLDIINIVQILISYSSVHLKSVLQTEHLDYHIRYDDVFFLLHIRSKGPSFFQRIRIRPKRSKVKIWIQHLEKKRISILPNVDTTFPGDLFNGSRLYNLKVTSSVTSSSHVKKNFLDPDLRLL